jgi:hypothetical protein
MLTELKPPVIERALLIFGKNIEIAQVEAQKMPVQMKFLINIGAMWLTSFERPRAFQ